MLKKIKLRLAVIKSWYLLTLCLLASFAVNASQTVQSTGWITDPNHPPASLRFMLTGAQDPSARQIEAVLEVQLEPEWKTYWRSPGEGGVAPTLDWSNSSNIADLQWHWPAPNYYELLGVTTLGYQSQVAFPITITLEDETKPAVLDASLRMASCTTICVITDYPIKLPFTPQELRLNQEAMFLYSQGMSNTPKQTQQVSIEGTYWDQANQTLTVELSQSGQWQSPRLFVDGKAITDEYFEQPTIHLEEQTLTATFKVSNWLGEADLTNKPITLTVADDTLAVELNTDISAVPFQSNITTTTEHSLFVMLGFALLGGLILNLMPCVLPVLGMKLNSIVSAQNLPLAHVRRSFIASALGIVSSFALLAVGISALKLGGQAIGWGIQFQNGWFIGFMFVVTLAFAANLFGFFELQLPSKLNTWLARQGDNSYLGHYVQGAFATLLATPCSAPFLGTAVAYALGASYTELWLIFLALGLGMSGPWILLAIRPKLITLLPKPGAWMFRVKMVFAVLMLATSLWLASLLSPFIGQAAMLLLIALVLLALIIWVRIKHGTKALLLILASIAFFLGAGLVVGSVTAKHWSTPIVDDLNWQPLNADEIPTLVAQGKTVFVDVTADWCITCKANKIGVILQDPVYSALGDQNIVLMKGDWTTPSDSVTKFLQSHQRYGVPFNIVYGPSSAQGIPLPVILNSEDVVSAIHAADLDSSSTQNRGE
ncbi:protein-disulfide reductase DsbD family protein [Vibrio tapetis]|uniref:Putative suppressor for copper-sensitivity B n=1 Tax=Vibrio tapetis subsp. tapetis TaxID=1671868 RepID=A0A2N8ZCC1_9VIBR|nr:protein-disulfide reductase DsbD domain-containing protein [Vibrio tapetis]SON49533.1 putative suppressor for copper-sensitivity B [Vibrio tapetis subsp. tapetis]